MFSKNRFHSANQLPFGQGDQVSYQIDNKILARTGHTLSKI